MNFKYILFAVLLSCCNYQVKAAGDIAPREWFVAASEGNLEVMQKLIGKVNINARDLSWTALIVAAYYNRENIVDFLLQAPGIDINAVTDIACDTALNLAAKYGHDNVVKLLLQAPHINTQIPDLNINAQDRNGYTAFMWAASNGHEYVLKRLIEAPHININAKNRYGDTALILAASNGHENAVRFLIQVPGIDINAQNQSGDTALICAVKRAHSSFVMESHTNDEAIADNIVKNLLLKAPGVDINAQNQSGQTAYSIAHSFAEKKSVIAKLIEEEFFEAIIQNHIDIIKPVIAQIGSDKITDKDGNTFLHKAFEFDRLGIAIELLKKAENPKTLFIAKNKKGQMALELVSPTSPIFSFLCMELAFIDPKSDDSLLQKAIKLNNPEIMREFLLADPICLGKAGKDTDNPELSKHDTDSIKVQHPCANTTCPNPTRECEKVCARCKKVNYCSAECQKAHWITHKLCCKKAN